jgi:hypothetical protein
MRKPILTKLRIIVFLVFCRLWIMKWVQMMTMNMQKKRIATSVQCVWMFTSTLTCVTLATTSSVSPAYGLWPKTILQALPAHCVGQLFLESFSRQVTLLFHYNYLIFLSDLLLCSNSKRFYKLFWKSCWKSYTAWCVTLQFIKQYLYSYVRIIYENICSPVIP